MRFCYSVHQQDAWLNKNIFNNMHASLVLARRFLNSTFGEKNLATMLILCALSTFMSIAVFMLMSAIMNGFQEATMRALQGIHSDITFEAPTNTYLHVEKIAKALETEFSDFVASYTPLASHYAIIQTEDGSHDISHVIMLQGIDPKTNSLKPHGMSLVHALSDKKIILGTALAEALQIEPGDTITLLFACEEKDDNELRFAKVTLTVGALFATGIDDIDRTIAFCSLTTFKTLLPDIDITQIGITLTSNVKPETAIASFKRNFSFPIYAWQELYPALLEGLALERFALFLILLLVALMTSINNGALLLMYITHHRKTIAIFFVMGMPIRQIRLMFVIMSVTITFIATFTGIMLALGISFLLDYYRLITLPAIYYTSYVPAHLEMKFALLVLCGMIMLSLCTSWWATGRIRKMNIANILKQGAS